MNTQTMRPAFSKGDRLRKARELTSMDAKAFAEALGLHRDSVRKYEATGEIRKYVLTAWADLTGVDEEWLENGDSVTNHNPGDYIAGVTSPARRRSHVMRPRNRVGTTAPKGRLK